MRILATVELLSLATAAWWEAETSNGKIEVKGARGEVKAKSSNGAMSIELENSSAGPVNVTTSNGKITLVIGSGFGGKLKMKTSKFLTSTRPPRESPVGSGILRYPSARHQAN